MESITAKEAFWGVRWQWDLKADEKSFGSLNSQETSLIQIYTDLLYATTALILCTLANKDV